MLGHFKRLSGWLLPLFLILAIWQHQAILDWWSLRNYQPTPQIVKLAESTTMTKSAKRIFYLSRPVVDSKASFNTNCPNGELQESLILGCYRNGQIYVLQVDEPKLAEVMPVTAAHEMLHAAYERLDSAERSRIDKLIGEFYPQIKSPDFKSIVAQYRRSEPSQLLNEIHSLLPTEVEDLPRELEDYYRGYFTDRSKVLKLFKDYESVFKDITNRRDALIKQLQALAAQIESLEVSAREAISQANNLSDQITQLRQAGRYEESNQLVAAQNAAAAQANSLINQVRTAIGSHNEIVMQINDLALREQDLYNALDASKLKNPTVPAN